MKLSIQNIGKIHEADIELNGITVIAGENNTGKSTVSKVLYSMFSSSYNLEEQIKRNRYKSIENSIMQMSYSTLEHTKPYYAINDMLIELQQLDSYDKEVIKVIIERYIPYNDETFSRDLDQDYTEYLYGRIIERLNISDEEIVHSMTQSNFKEEFNDQINNIHSQKTGRIVLEVKGVKVEAIIKKDILTRLTHPINFNTELIYIDNPFILDEKEGLLGRKGRTIIGHREHLRKKLLNPSPNDNVIESLVSNKKLENIYNKISTICSGEIKKSKSNSIGYLEADSEEVLHVRNLSAGLKTFVIIKKLLMDGVIEENGTIILDEPEIHLHPEWQLLFAELIVLIQKEFNMHILLTTHSPYFMRAIEVYSVKYGIGEKCNYYLAENENKEAYIREVTDNVELIYEKLVYPLQKLENMEWNND